MSSNVELVKRGLDAYNRRDAGAFMVLVTPYAELFPAIPAAADPRAPYEWL